MNTEYAKAPFQYYILVCEKTRDHGKSCCGHAGQELVSLLKDAVKERQLKTNVRVTRTGCLDTCAQGPNIIVMPEGRWYKNVQPSDINQILEELI